VANWRFALQPLAWETGHFAGYGKLTHPSVSHLVRMQVLQFSALKIRYFGSRRIHKVTFPRYVFVLKQI
jgi:hypothetical protein